MTTPVQRPAVLLSRPPALCAAGVGRWAAAAAATVIAGAVVAGSSGCAESAIAAAGATAGFTLASGQVDSFIRGELKSARMVTLEQAHTSVHHALEEMQLQVYRDRLSERDGALAAKAEGGREIKVYLKSDSPVITRITVRVGLLGDRAVSTLIMQQIDHHLLIDAAGQTWPEQVEVHDD